MEPETQAFDPSNRLLLIDVRRRAPAGVRSASVEGSPACSRPRRESRSDAAHWIALTLAGPRPDGSDGSVEVGGEVVSVRTLPDLLLRPGTPAVVDRSSSAHLLAGALRWPPRGARGTACVAATRGATASMPHSNRPGAEPEARLRPAPGIPVGRARVGRRRSCGSNRPGRPSARAQLRRAPRRARRHSGRTVARGRCSSPTRGRRTLRSYAVRDAVDDMPGVDVELLEERVDIAQCRTRR